MIWFLLWFVLSAILLGATFWSARVLFRQKRAWESFAKKYDMVYEKGQMMSSPTVTGFIDDFRVSLFAAERQAPDVRDRRMLSAIEVTFPHGLIDGGAAGTKEMLPFLTSLDNLHPYTPESDIWDRSIRLFVRNDARIKAWLSESRLKHLKALLSLKNSDNLILFDDKEAVMRVETRDPMLDPGRIDSIVKRLIKHGQGLMAQDSAPIADDEQRADQTEEQPAPSAETTDKPATPE